MGVRRAIISIIGSVVRRRSGVAPPSALQALPFSHARPLAIPVVCRNASEGSLPPRGSRRAGTPSGVSMREPGAPFIAPNLISEGAGWGSCDVDTTATAMRKPPPSCGLVAPKQPVAGAAPPAWSRSRYSPDRCVPILTMTLHRRSRRRAGAGGRSAPRPGTPRPGKPARRWCGNPRAPPAAARHLVLQAALAGAAGRIVSDPCGAGPRPVCPEL